MAKRLSRVAMVRETGDVETVDKTKLAFSGPRGAWRNQLRQMLAGAPERLEQEAPASPIKSGLYDKPTRQKIPSVVRPVF
jgi:hypothetical protein